MYFNSCLAYTYAKNAWNLVEYPILALSKSVMMIYAQDFLFYTFSLTRFQNLCQWMNWTGAHFDWLQWTSPQLWSWYCFIFFPPCCRLQLSLVLENWESEVKYTRFRQRWPTTFHLLANTVLIHSRACPSCSVWFLYMNSSGTQERDTAEEEELSCFSLVSRRVWINAVIDWVTKKKTHSWWIQWGHTCRGAHGGDWNWGPRD